MSVWRIYDILLKEKVGDTTEIHGMIKYYMNSSISNSGDNKRACENVVDAIFFGVSTFL